ncbi:hypothetical protein [Pedobacter jamesrossensis]|uniref:Uncharacterized protein n=1 Tax=Pedobacter jamesrossensis TaxID=1908238 RepID=A0ABV8NPR9_9SPHI
MDQCRKQVQIEMSNKMMATFLIALGVFVLLTYVFKFIESKSEWIQKIEKQFVAKNP